MGDPSSKKRASAQRVELAQSIARAFLTTSTFKMTSTVNPPPADLSAVVLKMESDGSVRLRTDDEATVDGNGDIDYAYFIISCAVGVSAASLLHRSKWNESGHKGRQGAMNAARMQHLLRRHRK